MHAEGMQLSLEKVLRQQVHCTENLLDALNAERAALIKRDVNALESAVQSKLENSRLLETLDAEREQLLSDLGFATDKNGMHKFLEAIYDTDMLSKLWQQVITNVGKCHSGNLTNGGILEAGRQQVEQALRILRGQQGTPALYNTQGETSADLGQRDLGKV